MSKKLLLGPFTAALTLVVACAATSEDTGSTESAVLKPVYPTPDASAVVFVDASARVHEARTRNPRATSPSTDASAPAPRPAPTTATCFTGHGACDPTDANSCAKGDACDMDTSGTFSCYGPPNDAKVGEACDSASGAGPFCEHGLTCVDLVCRRYCCDDSVCEMGTTCQFGFELGGIETRVCK